MKYYTVHEIRGRKNAAIKNTLQEYDGYEGRNLRDFFAANLTERYARNLFGQPENLKILDYGIASGIFAEQLQQKGFRNIYGLDVDNYLSEGNAKLLKGFKIADLNMDRLPWPDNSFDIITAWCVLPHLENPHHCIRETRRILKPGGLFILSIPHILSKASRSYFLDHGDFARYLAGKNHIFVVTPGVFQNAVLMYFQKVSMEYLIDPRSLNGIKGRIRKSILNFSGVSTRLKNYFENLWGYNQIWILQRHK